MKIPTLPFARKAVGVEIGSDGIKFCSLSKKGDVLLEGYETAEISPGMTRFSHREPNILQPEAFTDLLRRTHLKLISRTHRVAVSLPDSIGRVLLVDLDTRIRTRDEGADIIRWKMKKSFALDMSDMHLDYQVIRTRESGEISVLVSMIARPIIEQIEEVFLGAGLEPVRIDFTTFNLYRLFSQRLDMADNSVFFVYYEGILSILIFHEGAIEFFRTKEIHGEGFDSNRIYQEISNSLLVYTDKNPGRAFQEVFCFSSHTDGELFRSIAGEATDIEPTLLDEEKFVRCRDGLHCDRGIRHTLAASIGAGLGLIL